MLAKIFSSAVLGLEAEIIEVEVDSPGGQPKFIIVGLPEQSVKESFDRVKSAMKNSGLDFPWTKTVVNLAPADIRKEGSVFDLPIAVGIMAITKQIGPAAVNFQKTLFMGELGLDGKLRSVKGVVSAVIKAQASGFKSVVVPAENAREAALVPDIEVLPVKTLSELFRHLTGDQLLTPFAFDPSTLEIISVKAKTDMAHVKGQEHAKRALEIAAAGGHNVLMTGPPGSGKTLLARAFHGILPKLSFPEAVEATRVYSIAGMLSADEPFVTSRPFRTPHHTASSASLVGGGKYPRPGEISLAHRGVLFLDEFPEFPRPVLEALRQPLVDGVVTVSRVQGSLEFPASFILVAAQNPCPCGFSTDPDKECSCSAAQISGYQKKISGPLLDRIDLHVDVPRLKVEKLQSTEDGAEASEVIRTRIEAAREIQTKRFEKSTTLINSEMSPAEVEHFCELPDEASKLLRQAVEKWQLSARAYHRLLKISRSIADLEQVAEIEKKHVAEALQFRGARESS